MLRFLLIVFAVIGLGGFATILWMQNHGSIAAAIAAPPAPARLLVLMATKDLRAGALLQTSDIGVHEMPQNEVPPLAQLDSPEARRSLTGSMIRRSIPSGAVLRSGDLLHPGERGFLAAVLRPGMRAMTVAVDTVSGSAGLIWPGDHVDVVLTQAIDDPALPLGRRVAAEAMLHNVRVIAIDQTLIQGADPTVKDRPEGHTVTLEVNRLAAERVAVAALIGRLSLMVLAADGATDAAARRANTEGDPVQGLPVWAGDVSHALETPQTGPNAGVLHLWRGSNERKEFRF